MTDAKLIKALIESNKILREKLANAERRMQNWKEKKSPKRNVNLYLFKL